MYLPPTSPLAPSPPDYLVYLELVESGDRISLKGIYIYTLTDSSVGDGVSLSLSVRSGGNRGGVASTDGAAILFILTPSRGTPSDL